MQVADLDKSLEVTRQELGKLRAQAGKEDERWRAREQELLVYLEESHSHERKLEGQKHNLEVCLADATQQMQELEVFLIERCDDETRNEIYAELTTHDIIISGAPWRIGGKSAGSQCSVVAVRNREEGSGAKIEQRRLHATPYRWHSNGRKRKHAV